MALVGLLTGRFRFDLEHQAVQLSHLYPLSGLHRRVRSCAPLFTVDADASLMIEGLQGDADAADQFFPSADDALASFRRVIHSGNGGVSASSAIEPDIRLVALLRLEN